jgi:phage-related minor tail protein
MLKENAEQIKLMGAKAGRRFQKTDKQLDRTEKLVEKNAKEMEYLNKTVERVTKNVDGTCTEVSPAETPSSTHNVELEVCAVKPAALAACMNAGAFMQAGFS